VISVAGKADDPDHRQEVFEIERSHLGPLDILVNNAGINSVYGPLAQIDLGAARKILEVNLVGTLGWTQDAIKVCGLGLGERGGSIVNISSVTGQVPSPGIGWYGVTEVVNPAETVRG